MTAVDEVMREAPRTPKNGRYWLKRVAIGALLVLVGFAGWTGFKLWQSWNSLDRVGWDIEGAIERMRENQLAAAPQEEVPGLEFTRGAAVSSGVDINSILLVGNDNRPGFGGDRADVIMLVMFPDGEHPAVVSIPRDLYLENPCTGGLSRINATYNGCGDDATGPELLAIAVQNYTGVEVDHFALFEFEGFKSIIDEVGGVTICVENPVSDWRADLELPAGCTEATGAEALGWVRSRSPQELVNGAWRPMPGQSDLTRIEHQQEVIFQLFERLEDFSSLGQLTDIVDALSEAFVVDEDLSIANALSIVWDLRGLNLEDVVTLDIPVSSYVTPAGAQVLIPTQPFSEVLQAAFPEIETGADTQAGTTIR